MFFVRVEHRVGTAAVYLRVVADTVTARVFLRPVVHPVLVAADLGDSAVHRVLLAATLESPIRALNVVNVASTAANSSVVGEGLVPTATTVASDGVGVVIAAKGPVLIILVIGAVWKDKRRTDWLAERQKAH